MNRLMRNLIRLPRRALDGLARRRDPAYRLQRDADRMVRRWIVPARLRELESIPGNTSARKCRLLAHLATQAPQGGCIVEIGAFKGKSTAWLVEAAGKRPDRPMVVSIDPHDPSGLDSWHEFSRTVERFGLTRRGLEVRRARSHDVGVHWDRPISMLWIDGSHEYHDVRTDIEDFVPHVIPGGWIVLDDARGGRFPGVERAVAELLCGRPGFRDVGAIKHFRLFQHELSTAAIKLGRQTGHH
jgi:predicted O-methyltransferase YrrM